MGAWQAHVFTFERMTGSTMVTHTVEGAGSLSYTSRLTSGLGGLILGQNVGASRGLGVDLAEFLVYDRALTEGEVAAVTSYLVGRWGAPEEIPPAGCTAAQTSRVVPAFGLHGLLDVQVLGPGTVTSLEFKLDGMTDPARIASIRVHFTGLGAEFRPLGLFGSHRGPYGGDADGPGRAGTGRGGEPLLDRG